MLKDLVDNFFVDNLLLFDLDNPEDYYFEYSEEYDDYEVVQIYADEIRGQLCVCVDIHKVSEE